MRLTAEQFLKKLTHRKPTKPVPEFKVYPDRHFITGEPVIRVELPNASNVSQDPDEAERLARWLLWAAQEVKKQRKELLEQMIRPA